MTYESEETRLARARMERARIGHLFELMAVTRERLRRRPEAPRTAELLEAPFEEINAQLDELGIPQAPDYAMEWLSRSRLEHERARDAYVMTLPEEERWLWGAMDSRKSG